jgi:Asp-tRNA(Asn)/Glu-tRNA(Gln) amidotransferase A subunit family amidase
VSDFDLPEGSAALFDRHAAVMGYESARALAWEYTRFPEQISASLRPRLEAGWRVARQEYDEVRSIARSCRRQLADQLREFDFLLTPSAASAAPASLTSTGSPVFNRAWTLFGVPCVTLPFGKAANGLPLAVQLVGAMDEDMVLLEWAKWTARCLEPRLR